MSAFITLGNAARYLAGEGGSQEEIEMFAALLESEADHLRAVKTWTEHAAHIPGGVSYWRPPERWRILRVAFEAWCKANGHTVKQPNNAEPGTGKRARQLDWILTAIHGLGWNPLQIPYGGKKRLEGLCCENRSLFTSAGFDHAWTAALHQGLVRTAGHNTYAKR